MKLNFVASVILSVAFPALAAEDGKVFSKTGPEVSNINYEASARVDRPYEIGKATFKVVADCQQDETAAKKAIEAKLPVLQAAFDKAIASLGLGDRSELLNYKLDAGTTTELVSPFDNKQIGEQFVWTNRCNKDTSDVPPVRVKKVTKVTQTVTLWYPNQGKVLNSLTATVKDIEALSDKEATGVQVTCKSEGGGNYDLEVSESTSKAAWAEVEKLAKERAIARQKKDFATAGYQAWWHNESDAYFQQNGRSRLPAVTVEKVNGVWVATYALDRNYTVHYKKGSEPTGDVQLAAQKSYTVSTKTTGKTGLYGSLTITVTKACAENQTDAENGVKAVGGEILAKLREINGGKKNETEELDVKDPIGQPGNPLLPYYQIKDGDKVTYYYNPCNLEKFEVTSRPDVELWTGTQTFSITSSNLDALADLRDSLTKQYVATSDDPRDLKVDASEWSATATIAASEDANVELDTLAWEKFTARGSDFKCDAGDFSAVCLSQNLRNQSYADDFGGGAESAPKAAMAYSMDRSIGNVSAAERGAKKFIGKYVLPYTVRKDLKKK